jgi:two-component system, NarL family, invasion response regulator UvrY
MNVLIIEDHPLIQVGTRMIIQEYDETTVVFQSDNFHSALQVLEEQKIEVIILDLAIPGGEGTTMIQKLRSIQPSVKILVQSGFDERLFAVPYLREGANGFLSKTATQEEFLVAWTTILENKRYVSPIIQELLLEHISDSEGRLFNAAAQSLSTKELMVLQLIYEGKYSKEISIIMNLKENTISTYKKRIYEKFNVKNERELTKKLMM